MSRSARNLWLDIPLGDYEGHMGLPTIGQAQLLAETLQQFVRRYVPKSVAVIGCAGGNGFDTLIGAGLERVVGVDINPAYIEATGERYRATLAGLELYVADIERVDQLFPPVDLVLTGLLLEYVDVPKALAFVQRHCAPNGIWVVVLQRPHDLEARVSPSPYASLQKLESASHWVSPESLRTAANRAEFRSEDSGTATAGAKSFAVEVFRKSN